MQDEDLGYTDNVQHEIPVLDEVPINQPYRRIPPNQYKETCVYKAVGQRFGRGERPLLYSQLFWIWFELCSYQTEKAVGN
uniref:Uncharacterized protein n=1 Tax=Knipowitschia caucasica TaxID=637954 RepID=A0AAV2K420_KNICA